MKSLNYIMNRLQSGIFENNYNIVLCNYYLMETYFALKKYDRCLEKFKLLKKLKLSETSQKRHEKQLAKVSALEKKARRNKGKK